MGRKNIDPPQTTDEDIARIVGAVSRQIHREVLSIAERAARITEACIRFAPVALYCRHARESRGLDLKAAARAVKVPQYALLKIEEGDVLDLEWRTLERYIGLLGLEDWFASWTKSNSRLVVLLEQPEPVRLSIQPWELDLVESVMKRAQASRDEAAASPNRRRPARAQGSSAARPAQGPAQAIQLEVSLEHITPRIWRRIVVPFDATLHQLHRAIQAAVGWLDAHLYEFRIREQTFLDPQTFDGPIGPGRKTSRTARLSELDLAERDEFLYRYDFGDDWEHRVRVENVGAVPPRLRLPVCLAGERACPPEDSGGPYGYLDKLEALRDPGHPEHPELSEWMGEGFDPDAFDLEAANERLRRVGDGSRR